VRNGLVQKVSNSSNLRIRCSDSTGLDLGESDRRHSESRSDELLFQLGMRGAERLQIGVADV
jgi:hypothetical protein